MAVVIIKPVWPCVKLMHKYQSRRPKDTNLEDRLHGENDGVADVVEPAYFGAPGGGAEPGEGAEEGPGRRHHHRDGRPHLARKWPVEEGTSLVWLRRNEWFARRRANRPLRGSSSSGRKRRELNIYGTKGEGVRNASSRPPGLPCRGRATRPHGAQVNRPPPHVPLVSNPPYLTGPSHCGSGLASGVTSSEAS